MQQVVQIVHTWQSPATGTVLLLSMCHTAAELAAVCHFVTPCCSGTLNRVFQAGTSMASCRGQTRSMMKLSNATEMH